MKTFLITEIREDATGKPFEVKSKMQFSSIDAAIRYFKNNPNILWGKNYNIKEETKIFNTR